MTIMGSLEVQGKYDGRNLDKGLDKSKKHTKRLKKETEWLSVSMKGLGDAAKKVTVGIAGIATGIVAFSSHMSQTILEQHRLAVALGLTEGELTAFHRSAKLSGIEVDVMNDALLELSKRSAEATQGTGSMFDALGILNINVKDFSKLDLPKQFDLITKSIEALPSANMRNFLKDEIFGGASDTAGGSLKEIAAGFKAINTETNSMQSERALEFATKFDALSKRFVEVGRNLIIDVTPTAIQALDQAETLLKEMGVIKGVTKLDRSGDTFLGDQKTTPGNVAQKTMANMIQEVFMSDRPQFTDTRSEADKRAQAVRMYDANNWGSMAPVPGQAHAQWTQQNANQPRAQIENQPVVLMPPGIN